MVLESSTPGGSVSWIRFSVLLAIQLLMVTRAFSGSSCRTQTELLLSIDVDTMNLCYIT